MSVSAHRTSLDAALASLSAVGESKRDKLIDKALDFHKRGVIQADTLKAERERRDRETERRIKCTLFTKSRELFHLEQLCRSVAGTLGEATSWKKYFVGDPDFVLASTSKKVQRKAAIKRAARTASTRIDIETLKYSRFPAPDALPGAPVTKYQKLVAERNARQAQNAMAPVAGAGAGVGPVDIDTTDDDADDDDDDDGGAGPVAAAAAAAAPAAPVDEEERRTKKGRRRWATGYGALSDMNRHDESAGFAGRNRLGQSLPKDERWPAWDTPDPEVATQADYYSLQDDSRYFQQYGAYISDVMLAAMRETVSEIRVLDTMVGHGNRIPIKRLVCEALVSTMFAKWIASIILKNRYLSGRTWPKDVVIANLGYQLDVCRAFFLNPDKFSGSATIYDQVPPPPQNDVNYFYDNVDANDEDEEG